MSFQKFLPNVALIVSSILPTCSFGQTILWDFEEAGYYAHDWDVYADCSTTDGDPYDCGYPEFLPNGGTLDPGLHYVYTGPFQQSYESYIDSPFFQSKPTSLTEHGGGNRMGEENESSSVVTFSIPYSSSGSGGSDGFDAVLLTKNSSEAQTLLSLSLWDISQWEDLDRNDEDGFDHVIKVSHPVETNTQYRLRFRVYDYDASFENYINFAIDDIAVTNGAIIYSHIHGDSDNDGDVDGQDFLLWQRDSNPEYLWLDGWKSHYGQSSQLAIAVPEPDTVAQSWVLVFALLSQRLSRSEFNNQLDITIESES